MRTKGAKDKHPRKHYRGRPVKKKVHKGGKLIPYVPKRQKGDPLKLFIWEKSLMSHQGYRNWNRHIRPFVKRVVFYPRMRIDVEPERLSSKEEIGNLIIQTFNREGTFQIRMFGRSTNKYHISARKVADVQVIETSDYFKANVVVFPRLSRYWFWRNK